MVFFFFFFSSVMMFTLGKISFYQAAGSLVVKCPGWITNLNKFVHFNLCQLIGSVYFNERNGEQNEIWEDRDSGLSKGPGWAPKQPLQLWHFIGSLFFCQIEHVFSKKQNNT